eukprot:TRINITY_DN1478_c0_g1_i2.p1 TRINITY_DN1478_c0_g1~~TRINITY_DN1478_c0_g1_i2.p1  ORF type:complete len:175 (+),score=27.44 TRINITY_DN1478_c0_g1_i2:160-684(+)
MYGTPKVYSHCIKGFRIFEQMTAAFVHLQQFNMIHRDIASRNFVLTEDLQTVVLIDFGLSYILLEDTECFNARKDEQLPFRCLPPESLFPPHPFYKASDIWMLGIGFWETYNVVDGHAFHYTKGFRKHRARLVESMVESVGKIPLIFPEVCRTGSAELMSFVRNLILGLRPYCH